MKEKIIDNINKITDTKTLDFILNYTDFVTKTESKTTISKTQAEEFFERNSIYLDTYKECLSTDTAIKFLNEKSVMAVELGYRNEYWHNNIRFYFLTYKGFLQAVNNYNFSLIFGEK